MAEAAATQASWTQGQFWVTLAEVCGLVLVVMFTGITAKDAARSAKAAEDAVDVNRISSERQLRAYVQLDPAGTQYSPGDRILRAYVNQVNSGQTPARNVRFWGMLIPLPYPLPDEFRFPDPDFDESMLVIGAGTRFNYWARYKGPFFEVDLNQIHEKGERLYFIAVIQYDDIFGEPRQTRACWWYYNNEIARTITEFERRARTVGQPDINEPLRVSYYYTERHNDAD